MFVNYFSAPEQARIVRCFDGGINSNQFSTFKYIIHPVFKALSIKCVFFWHFYFWIILFRFKSANRKSAFIEWTSFKCWFSVNFKTSTFNKSHHFLVKLAFGSVCENLDAISARSAVGFFQPILQLSKESSWPSLRLRFLYLYASDVHQHTFNRSQPATSLYVTDCRDSDCSIGLQNMRACTPRRGFCLILELLQWRSKGGGLGAAGPWRHLLGGGTLLIKN